MKTLKSGHLYDTDSHRIFSSSAGLGQGLPTDKLYRERELLTEAGKARRIVLVLTGNCNLACSYCYAGQGSYGKSSVDRIGREKILEIMTYLEDNFPRGIEQLQFFGGEPFLEPKAIAFACSYLEHSDVFKKTQKTVVTNGTVLNRSILDMLVRSEIFVTVSLDGSEKYHDMFRRFKAGARGSYHSIVKNIEKMTEAGVYVAIQLTINRQMVRDYSLNLFDVDDFVESIAQLGVQYVHLSPIIDTKKGLYGFGVEMLPSLMKFQSDFMKALSVRKIYDNGSRTAADFLKKKLCNRGYCGAGIDEVTIDINGDVYPCFMFINDKNFILGNVRDGLVNHDLMERLQSNRKESRKGCRSCAIKDVCGMCIGASYIENRDISEPSLAMCAFQTNGYFEGVSGLLERML